MRFTLTLIDFPQLSLTREQRIAEAEAAWMREANTCGQVGFEDIYMKM